MNKVLPTLTHHPRPSREQPERIAMPVFTYKAAQRNGAMTQGTLTASSQTSAVRQLRSQGLTPVHLMLAAAGTAVPEASVLPGTQAGPAAGADHGARARGAARPVRESRSAAGPEVAVSAEDLGLRQRSSRRDSRGAVGREDVLAVTSELAVLLRAGLPIDRALKVQIDMCRKVSLGVLLQELLDTVKAGKPLSRALEARPELFGGFFVNMVRSGEASGRLGEVLERLAEYLERARETRSTVVSALIYPAILAVVAVLSVAVMLGFVVPQFEALFADMGDALPAMTRAVIAMGDAVKAWGWLMLLLAGGGAYALRRWMREPEGRAWRDRRLLRLPGLGELLFKYELARFARTLGTLLGNGVPLLQALEIALNTVENRLVRGALAVLPPAVKGGRRMSEVLAESSVFTPLLIQMVRVGEESGRLDDMMLELARVYDSEVEAGVKRTLTLLEPALILIMGGLIALIIISILMGILSVNDLAM